MPTSSRIIATGMTRLAKSGVSAMLLKQQALEVAMNSIGLRVDQLDGLITVPSLSETRFMDAHYLATRMGILPNKSEGGIMVKTLDTGGAGPVTALLEADNLIKHRGYHLVAVVAGDAVASMSTEDFLRGADEGCSEPGERIGGNMGMGGKGPVIPMGYNRVAEWKMEQGDVTREQLAMVSVLMSRQAVRHPFALTRKPHTLHKVLQSTPVASVTSQLECARRADGAAAVILASPQFIRDNFSSNSESLLRAPMILGGGEASGPLFPSGVITESMFSCERASKKAYQSANLTVSDIDYFGLYDCFPICFIKAVEDVGLAPRGGGGQWVEEMYLQSERQGGVLSPSDFPVNTHGGLLSFGAPWETPAMHSIIEAVMQLSDLSRSGLGAGTGLGGGSAARTDTGARTTGAGAGGGAEEGTGMGTEDRRLARLRQVPLARRALVYGNGGIFSASSVAILGRGRVEG